MDVIEERYAIAIERIREIAYEDNIAQPYEKFFKSGAEFILIMDDAYTQIKNKNIKEWNMEKLEENNLRLYRDVLPQYYGTSFANPEYAVKILGGEYGKILCFLYTKIRSEICNIYMDRREQVTLWFELFIEIYNYFESPELTNYKNIEETIYSFIKDNTEIFADSMADDRINPDNRFAVDIVMESDLQDLRYLYCYGEYVGNNEIKMAEFLNGLSEKEIKELATIYTEGYSRGFANTGKDLSKKGTVDIRYNLGFERIIRAAVENFKEMGLEPVIYKGGYSSTMPEKQYLYDHKFDLALYLDQAYVKRELEVVRNAYEKRKSIAAKMAGPAVIEVFGEKPFEPENKKEAYALSSDQQKLYTRYMMEYLETVRKYIKEDERSFTIIAFPIPEFGENFEQMFQETVKINTLDQEKYGKVQQVLIDILDKADYVRVTGRGKNRTNMIVQMHKLENPQKETNFENCLADVNIPLGEVFTSPKLAGTYGTLHVSTVYLNGLKYKDLEITFLDGKIQDYTCKNFKTEDENKRYIQDNIMFHHDTLPIGEFAIGTNTTAYAIANKYDIVYKLPILIVEKMGPHFAVGDTCYSQEEDVATYNPDGKKIVAKENEISALRKTDEEKAYFGCHTDITIPYEELGEITAVESNGKETVIIKNGRFVPEGTRLLNRALD